MASGVYPRLAQPRERWHARIVPARYIACSITSVREFALAQHRVLSLRRETRFAVGALGLHGVEHPVVQGAVIFKLQGTQRMRNPFKRIG